MNAIELLKSQHGEVAELFESFEKARGDARKQKLFEQIAHALVAHDAIEREIFYPACDEAIGRDDDTLEESLVEHGLVEFCLFRAAKHETSAQLEAYVKVLKEVVEHHVEEEQSELFPKVKKAMDAEQLDALGEAMEARFDEVVAKDFRRPLRENLKQVLEGKTRTKKKPAARSGTMKVASKVGRKAARSRKA